MADHDALRAIRVRFASLSNQLENRFSNRRTRHSHGSSLSIEERQVIERTLHNPPAPSEEDPVDLKTAQAFGDCKLGKQAAKRFHVAWIFAALLAIIGVVMPAVDERHEQGRLI
jgi:hypothetical protein